MQIAIRPIIEFSGAGSVAFATEKLYNTYVRSFLPDSLQEITCIAMTILSNLAIMGCTRLAGIYIGKIFLLGGVISAIIQVVRTAFLKHQAGQVQPQPRGEGRQPDAPIRSFSQIFKKANQRDIPFLKEYYNRMKERLSEENEFYGFQIWFKEWMLEDCDNEPFLKNLIKEIPDLSPITTYKEELGKHMSDDPFLITLTYVGFIPITDGHIIKNLSEKDGIFQQFHAEQTLKSLSEGYDDEAFRILAEFETMESRPTLNEIFPELFV